MLLHDVVRSKAESKLSFQEKEILSKILFKKNSTAETRDYSELEPGTFRSSVWRSPNWAISATGVWQDKI